VEIYNPIYEWIQAAHWDNLSYGEFRGYPVDYQELIIAAYRTENKITAVIAEDSK